ncbi:uncharacterized protein [Littorina saxatilis]|uniref:CUB domain-containing protein n=1 Tax=Littorina saxatilis TaxID=31220 RepID=A0AAN9G761_9CAEN
MFVFQRALILATLGCCLSRHQARSDLAVSHPQSSDVIVTTCSAHPLLPPISPSPGNQTVTVDFGQASPGNVSCVLTIPAYSNESSNAVTLMLNGTLPLSWCGQHNHLRLYDLDPESGNRSVIAEACDGVTTMSGRPGFDTLIVLEASGVDQSNMTLLAYSSFRWSTAVCNSHTSNSTVLNATVSKTVVHVPDATHALPRVTDCLWQVGVADGKGVTHVRVTMQDAANAGRSVPGTYGNSSCFYFMDTGVFMRTELRKIPVTEKGVDFEETGGESVIMGLVWRGLGGAPPFTVTYWAEGSTLLCPPSPRSLNATLEMQAFKGVNRGLHESAQDRNCSWRISAPSGMVVKLVDIYNLDFLSTLYSKDKLVIEGKYVAIDDKNLFPIWSEGESVEIDYVSSRMTARSQFVIKYLAVWPGSCQTLVTLNATGERNNVTEVALNKNDTSNGTNCHWLFKGRPGHQVEVTVTLDNQVGLCRQSWSGLHTAGITAFRGADQTLHNLILPQCLSDSNTWRFVSGDVITIVYDRDPSTSYVTDGVTVTYTELPEPPKPTGSACVFSPSVALLSFLLMLSFGRPLSSSFDLVFFA